MRCTPWLLLALWTLVHGLQLEHVVHHHLSGHAHGDHCHHHDGEEIPPGKAHHGGFESPGGCDLCEWNWCPSEPAAFGYGVGERLNWPVLAQVGHVAEGNALAVLPGSVGRRGPPMGDRMV